MDETVLKFTTSDVTIELAGSEDFVERQIRFFKHYLDNDSNGSDASGGTAETPSLETFFKERASRSGRGAIQEALLLFGYYLEDVVGQPEFSIEQIGWMLRRGGAAAPQKPPSRRGDPKAQARLVHRGLQTGALPPQRLGPQPRPPAPAQDTGLIPAAKPGPRNRPITPV